MSVLIVGCGYLGVRAARAWVAAGRRVYAVTRGRAEALQAEGIEPVVGDVTDPASLANLPAVDTVLYAVGLDRSAGKPMRQVYVDGLRNVLEALGLPRGNAWRDRSALGVASRQTRLRFIYISSTSVYGQTDGLWVDETSPTKPIEDSGRVVLEAERTLRELRPDAIVLRFAGIYGPDRIIRKASLLKGEPIGGDAEKLVNLIHVDDGVRAVLAAEAKGTPGETYLIADGHPVSRRDLFTATSDAIGAPAPRFEPTPSAAVEPNRRIANRKATESLGLAPAFPTYREGLLKSVLEGRP